MINTKGLAIAIGVIAHLDLILTLLRTGAITFDQITILRMFFVGVVCVLIGSISSKTKKAAPVACSKMATPQKKVLPITIIIAQPQNVLFGGKQLLTTGGQTQTVQAEFDESPEDYCEEPKELSEFHAVSAELASERAATKGMVTLFSAIDKFDLFGRRRVYIALSRNSAERLLLCENDMRSATEFTSEEQAVINKLIAKKWMCQLKDAAKTFYYGLDHRTAANLRRQLQY